MPPKPSSRAPRRPPNELVLACLERVGGMRGVRLASFVNDWAIEELAVGREITPLEFANSWSAGKRATAYVRLNEFRVAFGELGPSATPHHLITWKAPVAGHAKAERGWRQGLST